jgi:hypothetical protein
MVKGGCNDLGRTYHRRHSNDDRGCRGTGLFFQQGWVSQTWFILSISYTPLLKQNGLARLRGSVGDPRDRGDFMVGTQMCMTQNQGFVVTGLVTVIGIVAVRLYMCRAAANDFAPSWEAYHSALHAAQAARGQFLLKGFRAATKTLKDCICCRRESGIFGFFPLCCYPDASGTLTHLIWALPSTHYDLC